MKNPYFYLYYRLYRFAKRVGTVDATWTAMLLITVFVGFNVFTILLLFFNKNELFFLPPKIIGGSLAIIIGIINYFIFIQKDKCMEMIQRFENESELQRIISAVLTIIYIVLTLFLAHAN